MERLEKINKIDREMKEKLLELKKLMAQEGMTQSAKLAKEMATQQCQSSPSFMDRLADNYFNDYDELGNNENEATVHGNGFQALE